MSVFSLFKSKAVIALDDPVFGRITFDRHLWVFIPNLPTSEFMITVDAPKSGPTQRQRDFFQNLRASLPEFERRARDFIRLRVDSAVDVSRLLIYSVDVGSEEETKLQRFVLEMSDADASMIHRVTFCGSKAVDYGHDD